MDRFAAMQAQQQGGAPPPSAAGPPQGAPPPELAALIAQLSAAPHDPAAAPAGPGEESIDHAPDAAKDAVTPDGGVPPHPDPLAGLPDHPVEGPTVDIIDGHSFLPHVAEVVRHIMAKVPGLVIESGGRDAHTNMLHGGVPGSLHLEERAVDFSGSASDLQKAAGIGRVLGAVEVSINRGPHGQIVHLGF